jgi:hypothetical protein
MTHTYIQWARFQRRPVALQKLMAFDVQFVDSGVGSSRLRVFDYVVKSFQTFAFLSRTASDVVWVAAPPVFAIYLAFAILAVSPKKFRIVIDCHNGVFLRPWVRFPLVKRLLRAADLCVVHTRYAQGFLESYGVDDDRIMVLEDFPPTPSSACQVGLPGPERAASPYIVIPSSFRRDQPVALYVEIARLLGDVTVFVTGDHKRRGSTAVFKDAPANLVLTGYLEPAVYDSLIVGADALLGLTLRENAIVSAAAEGLGFNAALVLSDTPPLRVGFPKGALFVDTHSAQAIADGVREAIRSKARLKLELAELHLERVAECRQQADRVFRRLQAPLPHKVAAQGEAGRTGLPATVGSVTAGPI